MGPDAIFEEVYAPFKDALEKDWSSGFDELMRVDSVSTRGYIREKRYAKSGSRIIYLVEEG